MLKVNGAEKSPCIICVEQAGKHYAFIHNDMLDDKFKAKAISGTAASTDYSLYEIETIDIVDSSAKAGNERGFQIKLAGSDITIRSNARAIEISSSTDKLTATPADADKGTFGYDFSKKPSKTKLFLKVLLTFILTYSSIFLSLFLTSGTSYGQVIMFDLNGFYLVLLLLVFSLLISLFSFILEFLPIAKSSLSDYFLSFKIKDETLVEENESSR